MTFVRTAAIGTATAGGRGAIYLLARSIVLVLYYYGIRSGPGARDEKLFALRSWEGSARRNLYLASLWTRARLASQKPSRICRHHYLKIIIHTTQTNSNKLTTRTTIMGAIELLEDLIADLEGKLNLGELPLDTTPSNILRHLNTNHV